MTAQEQSHTLEALAGIHGITRRYHDGTGVLRTACDEAVLAVLRILGAPVETIEDAPGALREAREAADRPRLPTLLTSTAGEPVPLSLFTSGTARLVLESGETSEFRLQDDGQGRSTATLPGIDVPGYHHLEAGGQRIPLLVAPALLPAPRRGWGLFAPLYGLRSGANGGGLATYGDLARFGNWIAGPAASYQGRGSDPEGGDAVYLGTLPLLAGFFEAPFEPSPYSPISRAFWSELYVDPAASPDLDASPEARRILGGADYREACAARSSEGRIDYRRVMGARRRVLEALVHAVDSGAGARRDAFEAALADDDELQRYAAFRASVESHQWTWEGWPERARRGDLKPGVDYDGEAFRYHAYAQWLARAQVAAAAGASRAGLYLDLPLGSHGGGYDTWRHPHDFALGASAGAPPDNVFEGGQNWAFPPLHPEKARAGVYAPLRAALRHHFEHASVLRVDHVMGLHRLFWIPSGFSGADGVYVRSHARELWSILAIEAARARGGRGAAVVGEDLGTVPDEVRHEMNTRGALRMFVLPFEQQEWQEPPLRTPPADALACTGTHDMEPFAAWWTGLGDRRARLAAFLGCDADDPAAALAAALAWLARSEASIVLASLEDLWLETERQNMPGTVSAAGNWQRPFALAFEEFTGDAEVAGFVSLLRDARATFPSPTIAAARSPA